MRLFQIPEGQRVRITSKLIRWVEYGSEQLVGDETTWEGTTTDRYFFYKGFKRRLIVDHTVEWDEYGIWQKDTEAVTIPHPDEDQPKLNIRKAVLINE
jgi:hypothetical protein